jgi:site-specific DNA recombinase
VLGQVDDWFAEIFAPANLDTLAGQAAQLDDPAARARAEAARARIAECDGQISRYRASLDAGGDPAVIGPWIAETQAEKVAAQAEIRTVTGRRQLSRDDLEAIVAAFADIARVVREADPADKAELYAQLKLTLTYQPGQRLVEATVKRGLDMRKVGSGCRGAGTCVAVMRCGGRGPGVRPVRLVMSSRR